MPRGSYAAYEDAKRFKKRYIPIDMAHSLVPIFRDHGITAEEVLALAGIGPEAIQPVPPPAEVHYVTMRVALPSEAALTRMFEGLLLPLDHELSRAELARTLAQRLPIGLAQVQDLLPQLDQDGARGDDEAPPAPATGDRASPRAPRT